MSIQEINRIRKKKITMLVASLTILIAIVIGIFAWISKQNADYDAAVSAFNQRDYSRAVVLFDSIDGYRDATEWLQKSHYNLGVKYLDEGENASALEEFNAVGEYSDASTKAKESRYRLGVSYMRAGDYQSALLELDYIDDYRDVADLVIECKYQHGMSLLNQGDYSEAHSLFASISGYKDVDTYLETYYQEGIALIQKREYVSAKEVFDSIYSYKDSSDKSKECRYLEGVRLYNNDELHAAYNMLEPIADYRDAQSYISSEKRNIFSIIQSYIDNGMNVLPVRDDIREWDRRSVNIFDCIERDFNAVNRDSSTVSSKYHIDVSYTVMDGTGVPYYDLTCRNAKGNLRYYLTIYQFDNEEEADQMAEGFNTVEDSGDKFSARNYACGNCVVNIMGFKEEIEYLDMY